jgi:PIN domain nuclease of toxin-antitoxin system
MPQLFQGEAREGQGPAVTPGFASEAIALGSTRTGDPVARIIVAAARVLGVPLVTSDARIIDSKLVPTIS